MSIFRKIEKINSARKLLPALFGKNGVRCYGLKICDLPDKVQCFLDSSAELCNPDMVHVCDGSPQEARCLQDMLIEKGALKELKLYKNSFYARTDPKDVARMESRTFLSTFRKEVAVPEVEGEAKPSLGNWMPLHEADCIIKERFENCMKGRTMYLVPYVMGPIGSHMSRPGVELTDSAYVALSMGIMTRMGERAVGAMKCSEGTSSRLVKGLHCSGRPKDGKLAVPFWPCDPERTVIVHKIEQDEIFSYGSGYGGNSLLAKKCHALRLGSYQAKCEGWLAEHMLIMGVEPECGCGRKHYLTAAFPSACGKTNLAMMKPAVAGYKVSTVGDDIAWIHFNRTTGKLHAINPEYGMFGVAPGTSWKTNPNAMATFMKNAMFTNVALTDDGGVWWEGMEEPCKGVKVTDWHGKPWDRLNAKTPAAHGNSRFTCPIYQCPSLDKDWENCDGVPVSGIIFGGRRPHGMPLVYEALSWNHGVLVGSFVKSEATAAAEHKGGTMMHDPFAMRPFYGYNAGHYLQHWLDIGCTPGLKQPKIFHVNWFLRNKEGGFAWPGYGENIRVLEWMLRRIEGDDTVAEETPIGYVPKEGAINMEGLDPKPDHDHLFKFDKEFWLKEVEESEKFLNEQYSNDLPCPLKQELEAMRERICAC